ncbi:hypothetical protein ERJ75_000043000 [Trypanosoma vivax]|nr:hypothetical protein ERJ75_000043000 [Trypanosoma vivax]
MNPANQSLERRMYLDPCDPTAFGGAAGQNAQFSASDYSDEEGANDEGIIQLEQTSSESSSTLPSSDVVSPKQ